MPNHSVSAAGGAVSATAFITVTPAMRRALESLIDDLVLLLDEIDGDADLEPTMGYVPADYVDEAEDVSEDEGGQCDDEGAIWGDTEPELGW